MRAVERWPVTEVAVCVVTYRRPVGLYRLMRSLARLRFDKCGDVTLQVIVVDNDAAGSAREIVEWAAERSKWPIRYAVEPQWGISYPRNCAVALASHCEYIAFVDDDEVVESGWLDELLCAQKRYNADVVAGPVPPAFESKPPRWVVEGRLFERYRYPTGANPGYIGAGNVLIRRRILDGLPGPFDPRFALTGGEDNLLFWQLDRPGFRRVWCDEAIATEYIPASRTRLRSLLRRAYSGGNVAALCEKEMDPSARRTAIRAAKGMARIGQGLLGVGLSPFFGRGLAVRSLTYVAKGVGSLAGVLGHRFEVYR